MRASLTQYLACPICQGDLRLEPSEDSQSEVQRGELVCAAECGRYPIESGVPRLLPELVGRPAQNGQDIQRRTGRSFGAQWDMYQYGDTTWGVSVEERLQVVLHELGWKESDLEGKVIVDAGCGNGTLSHVLAEHGATVLALDLSDSVFRAAAHCSSPGLHFIQGNLFYPPFRHGIADAIYSCGVFHHTPDTRRCFDALVPALRPDQDARYFVWLYAKRSALFNASVEPLMKLTRRMPSWLLVPMCYAASPPVEFGSRLLTQCGVLEYAPRTFRDRAIQLHDLLSPSYVHYHSFEEAKRWAQESGFKQIKDLRYRADGGERAEILDKYRTVCRPGFGMLCEARHPPAEISA